MEYKTTHRGTDIEYHYDERKVAIHRNGEFWGYPQGERFMVALLEDIKKLQKEIEQLEKRYDEQLDESQQTYDFFKQKIEEQQKDIEFFLKKQEANNQITQELVALNDPRIVAILTKARMF